MNQYVFILGPIINKVNGKSENRNMQYHWYRLSCNW